jgi:predicted phage-related endonuclease
MKIHKLIQGTPEWDQFRLEHFGASEAAMMLGLSSKVKRTELLHMKHTGIAKEFSDWVQEKILDPGHEVEALARPINERTLGEDLYPVTCSEGLLSASCDGLTMLENIGFEHKQYNEALFEAVSKGELPDEYMPQPQQCLMVTGAEKWLFCVSDGTEDRMATMWIYPDPVWFDRIAQGWTQFAIDLESYQPVQFDEKPAGKAVIELPALFLQAEGKVVNSNMEAFGTALTLHLAETRQMVYVTDQDFADADKRAKLYRETCKKLEITKAAMLEQTVSIGEAFRLIDTWHEDLRVTALQIEKDVTKNTDLKKVNIINEGKIAYTAFITELEKGIAPIRLNYTMPNFAEAIKGKRLFSAMHDAVQTMLANAKIETNKVVTGIAANQNWLKLHDDYMFLLNDLQTIIYKPADDFQRLVSSRVKEHQDAEAEKLEAARQQAITEERARAETAAAIEAAKAKEAEEQRQRAKTAEEAKRQVEAFANAVTSNSAKPAPVEPFPFPTRDEATIQRIPPPAELMPSPRTETPPTLRLGQIVERLGFTVTADFLASLGINHVTKEKSSILYHERDFLRICDSIAQHLATLYRQHKQAA